MKHKLQFVSLGGAGEIGMNLNLYGLDDQWLMVDLGVSFGVRDVPFIDTMMPDPVWIENRRDNLLGLVITHGHEDHLGAVAYLWPRLRCPVYATPFAGRILIEKLREAGLENQVPLTIVPLEARFSVGAFDIELITLTHSIPEPNALAIRTPVGVIFHTGDWKFDDEPLIGEKSNLAALRDLGSSGVLAIVGDSTNALVAGRAGSEMEVRQALKTVLGQYKGKIAIGCFATNIARLSSIAIAAAHHGRSVSMVGRSLKRMATIARELGYLEGIAPFVEDRDAVDLADNQVLYVCTGSQGEMRAALSKIANDKHPHVHLGEGDTVIFSSRVIPGNEQPIDQLKSRFIKRGVTIVSDKDLDETIHVSGHPCRDELIEMYQLIRPKIAIPVHGEYKHIQEHKKIALECQVPYVLALGNGDLVELSETGATIIDQVPVGRLGLDGKKLIRLDHDLLTERRRVAHRGAIVVSVVIDAQGQLLAMPQIWAQGLLEEDEVKKLAILIDEALALQELPRRKQKSYDEADADQAIKTLIHKVISQSFKHDVGHKPLINTHLTRV